MINLTSNQCKKYPKTRLEHCNKHFKNPFKMTVRHLSCGQQMMKNLKFRLNKNFGSANFGSKKYCDSDFTSLRKLTCNHTFFSTLSNNGTVS